MSGQLSSGWRFRPFSVIDDFTKQCHTITVDTSISGHRVARELNRLIDLHGRPQVIVCDNGREFISRDLDLWAYQKDVVLDFSRPGTPMDNAFIESFNGKFRAECLNAHWFMSLDDARLKMEEWRRDYNEVRPHSAIGNNTPVSLQNSSGPLAPP